MIKANVGRSQKVSRDYQSQGFSVNLEGEITAPVSDPEAVVEQIKELYDLADEALRQQIERHQSIDAIASRDEERAPADPLATDRPAPPTPQQPRPQPTNNNYPPRSGGGNDAATPKQMQFIQNLAKRQRLSTAQLEGVINDTIGHPSTLHQLTKKEAGAVIDALNQTAGDGGNGARR